MTFPDNHPSGSVAPRQAAVRRLGRFQLFRLLGKSERTMAWQATDARDGQDLVLVLPRVAPAGADAADRWLQRARRAGRLSHPNLATVFDIGIQDGWPFVAYELEDCATLSDRIGNRGMPAVDAASLISQLLQGLAFAHDAEVVHGDVQAFLVLTTDKGRARLMGAEVAGDRATSAGHPPPMARSEASALHAHREAAQADVLQAGLLLHHALAGSPALDEPDTGKVADRLPPVGRDIVRLPWTLPRPIPDALRAIVNRASDRQERQRYRSARTLVRALDGWITVESSSQSGPIVLVLDRIRTAGMLPAAPGGAARASRLALMEAQHNSELSQAALEDTALAFELLRAVNVAQAQAGHLGGSGPVLTIRRAIAMLGMDGVRRAASSLRPWPGALREGHVQELARLIDRCRRAAQVAVALRPAGYDPEVVYLVTMFQNLGRLIVQYHFADEAQQIRRLMQPAPGENGAADEPGMSEQAAAFAVLGVDIEAIGTAVVRHWGFDDAVVHLARRVGVDATVRAIHTDDDALRTVASCANEAIDALSEPPARVQSALQAVVNRYGRPLMMSGRDLQAALKASADVPPPAAAADSGRPPSRPHEPASNHRVAP